MGWYLAMLKQFAVFAGRTSRREYWKFFLVNWIIWMVLTVFADIIKDAVVIKLLLILAAIVFGLAVAVRRLHDADLSGWWMLLSFIPFFGSVALMILFILPGKPAENRFGPAPTQPTAAGPEGASV